MRLDDKKEEVAPKIQQHQEQQEELAEATQQNASLGKADASDVYYAAVQSRVVANNRGQWRLQRQTHTHVQRQRTSRTLDVGSNEEVKDGEGDKSDTCWSSLSLEGWRVCEEWFVEPLRSNVRRVVSTNIDPKVEVSLRVAGDSAFQVLDTKPFLGGGYSVHFDKRHNNSKDFLLASMEPGTAYLRVEVVDYETGANDIHIGKAYIVVDELMQHIGHTLFCDISLHNEDSGRWAGTVELSAKIFQNEVTSAHELTVTVLGVDNLITGGGSSAESKEESFWYFLASMTAMFAYTCFGAAVLRWSEGGNRDYGTMIWFMVQTITAVGYGDLSLTNDLSKVINSFFIMCNAILLSATFSLAFAYVYHSQSKSLQRKTMFTQLEQSEWFKAQSNIRERIEVKSAERSLGHAITFTGKKFRAFMAAGEDGAESAGRSRGITDADEILNGMKSLSTDDLTTHRQKVVTESGRKIARSAVEATHQKCEKIKKERIERKEIEGLAFRRSVILSAMVVLSLFYLGTLYFSALDAIEIKRLKAALGNYSVIDGIRWCLVTVTTIGYGDMAPTTVGGRCFGIFFMFYGISLLTRLIGMLLDSVRLGVDERKRQKKFARSLTSADAAAEFDTDGDGEIDRFEYLSTMLVILGDVDKKVISRIMRRFKLMDFDGNGEITVEEFKAFITKENARQRALAAKKIRR